MFWESSDIWHGNWFYKTQDLVPESGPWPNLLALFPPCNCPLHLDINIMLCDTWMAFFLHFSVQNPLLLLNMLGPRATAATRKFYPTLNNAKKTFNSIFNSNNFKNIHSKSYSSKSAKDIHSKNLFIQSLARSKSYPFNFSSKYLFNILFIQNPAQVFIQRIYSFKV